MADYNAASTTIAVSPQEMHSCAAVSLKRVMTDISDCWRAIGQTWDSIHIGWIGDSATAADEFNARLTDIQQRLFGVPNPDGKTVKTPGLLDKVRSGVVIASVNYNNAERSVSTMWNDFCILLNQEADKSDKKPSPYKDTTLAPITADFTDNPYTWHEPKKPEPAAAPKKPRSAPEWKVGRFGG